MKKKLRLDHGQIEVIDDEMAEILKQKKPAERIGIGFNLWVSSVKMLSIYLKKKYPDWTEAQIKKELARRFSHGAV